MTKILIVEDDQTLRDVYALILQISGYDIDTASNGLQALEKYHANSYDVILLDLMMPELDGVGFLQQAQVAKHTPELKVIIFSNLSSGELLDKAFDLGAHEHVLKANLTPEGLITVIQELTGQAAPVPD